MAYEETEKEYMAHIMERQMKRTSFLKETL